MIEMQIRRPCSKTKPLLNVPGTMWLECPECGAVEYPATFMHKPVYEWVPVEQVVQMAHTEATLSGLNQTLANQWHAEAIKEK